MNVVGWTVALIAVGAGIAALAAFAAERRRSRADDRALGPLLQTAAVLLVAAERIDVERAVLESREPLELRADSEQLDSERRKLQEESDAFESARREMLANLAKVSLDGYASLHARTKAMFVGLLRRLPNDRVEVDEPA
jgi:hypothetical protein